MPLHMICETLLTAHAKNKSYVKFSSITISHEIVDVGFLSVHGPAVVGKLNKRVHPPAFSGLSCLANLYLFSAT